MVNLDFSGEDELVACFRVVLVFGLTLGKKRPLRFDLQGHESRIALLRALDREIERATAPARGCYKDTRRIGTARTGKTFHTPLYLGELRCVFVSGAVRD